MLSFISPNPLGPRCTYNLPLFGDWWQPWLKLTNESNKRFQILRYIMSSPKICALNWIQQWRPQMPICTYLKQIGAPPISQNSWGARVQVCLQKIYVMHMTKIFTSFQKKRKFGSVRADRSDRSVLAELKNNSSSFQSASH